MPETPNIPPFRKPVSLYKTPDQTIIFVTELVNRDDPAYVQNAPVKRGTLYKDIVGGNQQISDTHPLLYFCRELQYQQSDQYVIWEWSSDEQAHSSYNADITYEEEVAGFPVFTRDYTIRRDEYEQNPTLTIGDPLESLIGVNIIDGGQDYTYATGTIEGKEAVVEFVVSDGVIISGVVSNEGVGILATDVITITGDGAGASITPMVQPTSAVLTSQKKEELPDDNPWANEFVKVTRVYQTLPGPTIHSTDLHVDGIVVDTATTLKVASTIVSGETLVGTTWTKTTKKQSDNGYTAQEIVMTREVPGNPVPYTKLDDDGKVVTGVRTLKDTTLITTAETLVGTTWTHTTKELLTTRLTIGEEASDLVSWEVKETRAIPGNPMPSSRLDEDGIKVNVVKTMESAATIAAITTRETLVTGTWTKITSEYISDLVSWKVVETRAIPGNTITEQTIDDRDGKVQTVTRIMSVASTITPAESIVGGVTYRKIESKPITELVAWQIQTDRAVPGNSVVDYEIDDRDGKIQTITRILSDASTITPSESIVGGVTYRKVESKPVTDILAWQVQTDRPVPGNNVIKTVIDADGDIVTETRSIVVGPPTLVTTITTAGGVYTKTFGEPINDLISWKVIQVKATQNELDSYEVSIPDLMPEEFQPQNPVTTTEQTLIGTASLPTLVTGDLMRRQAQIDYNTYRLTIRGRGTISLYQEITNKELTSEFGGGDVNRILRLDLYNNLSLIEGLTVLTCNIRKIDSQANGLAVRTTRQLNDSAWPVLDSTHVDEKYQLIVGIQKQTLIAGTIGGVDVDGTIREVRSHDKWKSIQIASKFDTDSIPEDVQWFGSMLHSFPPELSDAVIDWAECTCNCSDSFSAVLIANVQQYTGMVKTRITEQFYYGVPPDDVTITQFFPQSHHFGFAWCSSCGDSDGNCRTKSGAPEFHIPLCLHDDLLLCIGNFTPGTCADGSTFPFPFAATSPAALPHGSYITLAPHVERWRFGVFRRVITEVLVPA